MKSVDFSEVKEWLDHSNYVKEYFLNKESFCLTGFASVEKSSSSDVSFWVGDTVKSETNAFGLSESILNKITAGLIFVPENFATTIGNSKSVQSILPKVNAVVAVSHPYHVMVEFLKRFAMDDSFESSCIAKTAVIHPSAVVEGSVGENCYVGPNCVVMRGSKLADNCILEANVTVYSNVEIGEGCVFQAGAVIGSRGFGFYDYQGERRPVPHLAGVRIGKHCGFGANMVVAAGFVSPTVIGDRCHFDSFVQIAHNCILGNDIYMASQSGIAGTVTVEDGVELAGGAQTAGHLTLGKGAHVAAKAGVTKSVAPGKTVAGFPAEDIDLWRRSVVKLRLMGKK